MKTFLIKGLLAFLSFNLLTNFLNAATITWGEPTTIAGDSDVTKIGTTIGAYTFGDLQNPTINEITFNGITPKAGYNNHDSAFGSNAAPFSELSLEYQTLLQSGSFQRGPVTFKFDDLVIGQKYQIQVWVNDSRALADEKTLTLTAGKSVTLSQNTTGVEGGVGQYIIGTWVADEVSQIINVSSTSGVLINAYRLSVLVK